MSQSPAICYIGLGSNLENPQEQVERALLNLDLMDKSYLLAYSSLYRSQPMGPQDQPPYINAVAKLATLYSPLDLLGALQSIENLQARIRSERWGARTLDLDLLVYNLEVIQSERLTVPHYGLKQRDFVLQPLYEIAPRLRLPDGSKIKELLTDCKKYGLEKLK